MLKPVLATFLHLSFLLRHNLGVKASPVLSSEASLEERAPYVYQDEADISNAPRGPDFSGDLPAMWPTYSWQHDLADLANLVPVRNKILYYTDSGSRDESVDHQYATMDTTFAYPVVVQSHSSLIDSVTCLSDGRVKVRFGSTKAANYAKEHWSTYTDENPFVLVAHSKGCNAAVDGQNTFFKIKSMKHHKRAFGGADFELAVEQLELEESVGEVDLTWGHHEVRDCSDGKCDDGGATSDEHEKDKDSNHDDKKHDDHKGKADDHKGKPDNSKGKDGGKKDDCKDGKDGHSKGKGNGGGGGHNSGDFGCTDPPSAEILGFPTGPCGPLFDVTIDDRLGYYDFSGNFSASLRQFAPGLPSYDINAFDPDANLYNDLADPELVRRVLRKRGWFKKAFRAVAKVVKAVVQPIINTVREVIVNKVTNIVNQAIRAVTGLIARLTNIQGSYSRIFDTGRIGPEANSDSPWGRQYRILQVDDQDPEDNLDYALSGWCVDCGVRSTNKVLGRVRFNLCACHSDTYRVHRAVKADMNGLLVTFKVLEAAVALSGNFNASLFVGLDGVISYQTSRKVNVISVPVGTPFFIPGVFIFGGQVSLDVEAYVALGAEGRLLVGGSLVIPNYQARLDLINQGTSGVSGFTPRFVPAFNARGNVTADLGLGLPIELGFGLTIPAIPGFSGLVGLRNTPWVVGTARGRFSSYSYYGLVGTGCTNAIQYRVDFINKLEADFFGSRSLLNRTVRPITSGCYRPRFDKRQEIDLPGGGDSTPGLDDGEQPESPASPAALENLEDDAALVAQVNTNLREINREQNANATAQGVSTPDEDGFNYIPIRDSNLRYAFIGDERGSLRLANAAPDQGGQRIWANYEGAVTLDSAERVLHYYPAQMAAFGVSRFRVLDSDTLPRGSSIIELVRFQATKSQSSYIALNTRADSFYLVACELRDQETKFFLAKNADGRQKLMDPKLRYIVTGGVVTSCGFIQLV